MRVELQKWVVEKCLRENQAPFTQEAAMFKWSGDTRVKSKKTGRVYPVQVELSVETDRRLNDQLSACLCRSDGVRVEDLRIVHMIHPRLSGKVAITGLPPKDIQVDFSKFLKQIEQTNDE
ncbi:hypothetical protein [Alicyclobacillus fodiniaquatilis]|uniref:Uncharacterized protein n=1 Tax=Alicyclobacillus fodiniaquatilis TaxID=1661150 RepID=A0ABW4JJ25_9BACL